MAARPHNANLNAMRRSPSRLQAQEGTFVSEDETLYRTLVDHTPVGLMVVKPEREPTRCKFRIVAANQAVIAISQLKDLQAADLPGKTIEEVFPLICNRDLNEALAQTACSGKTFRLGQLQHGERPAAEHGISIQAFGLSTGCLGLMFETISENKHAERALLQTAEELTRSNTELDQFAHAASHDLQEPLRSISSLTRLLLMDYADKLDAQ
ncbi:MAG TPA: PAS domain-containing protein, partial [Candidatus Eisenbacteria bacterium]|nr:PAS domain-containing protein [Candidatus Eisenbacteria bacterium]